MNRRRVPQVALDSIRAGLQQEIDDCDPYGDRQNPSLPSPTHTHVVQSSIQPLADDLRATRDSSQAMQQHLDTVAGNSISALLLLQPMAEDMDMIQVNHRGLQQSMNSMSGRIDGLAISTEAVRNDASALRLLQPMVEGINAARDSSDGIQRRLDTMTGAISGLVTSTDAVRNGTSALELLQPMAEGIHAARDSNDDIQRRLDTMTGAISGLVTSTDAVRNDMLQPMAESIADFKESWQRQFSTLSAPVEALDTSGLNRLPELIDVVSDGHGEIRALRKELTSLQLLDSQLSEVSGIMEAQKSNGRLLIDLAEKLPELLDMLRHVDFEHLWKELDREDGFMSALQAASTSLSTNVQKFLTEFRNELELIRDERAAAEQEMRTTLQEMRATAEEMQATKKEVQAAKEEIRHFMLELKSARSASCSRPALTSHGPVTASNAPDHKFSREEEIRSKATTHLVDHESYV